MIKNFEELEALALSGPPKKVALAMAEEADVLTAIVLAMKKGIVHPLLVGNRDLIEQIAREENLDLSGCRMIPAEGEKECAARAVELVRNGEADCLMKGKTATSTIMKAVLSRESGIRGNSILSHVAILNPPSYHKLLIMTDAAMNISPDLEIKVSILNNAVQVALKLGVECPKVAVIGAVEKVNKAMQATIDAAMLSKMADRGQIENCLIDGPFALDNAVSAKSCEVKGITTRVGGDADILLLPNIEAANVMYKTLSSLTDYPLAGILVGAQKPIIMTSRADTEKVKYLSILAGVSLS